MSDGVDPIKEMKQELAKRDLSIQLYFIEKEPYYDTKFHKLPVAMKQKLHKELLLETIICSRSEFFVSNWISSEARFVATIHDTPLNCVPINDQHQDFYLETFKFDIK